MNWLNGYALNWHLAWLWVGNFKLNFFLLKLVLA